MLQILKSQVKQRLKEDELLQAKIATNTGKKISTVKRWIEVDHIMLTTSTVLNTIRDHEGLSKEVELTEVNEEEAKVA
jgi:hypothetical protein